MTKKRALVAIPLTLLAGLVVLALLVRGGGSSDSGLGVAKDSGGSSGAGDIGAEPATPGEADSLAGGTRQAVAVDPISRAVISTGQVTLQSEKLANARAEAIRLANSWGGGVADERSSSDKHGRLTETTMTLRIPSDRFDDAMAAFDELGDVKQRSQKSEDVTTKVIDNDARVRAAERSIRQIEALLSRAEKLGDIIAIESDLARRQADLDSLKSQQASLKDQTSLSTINLYMSRPLPHAAPHEDEAKGFLAGLENGWGALGATTVVALTVVGAVLPFAVLGLVLGVPVWLVVRRRRLVPPPAGA